MKKGIATIPISVYNYGVRLIGINCSDMDDQHEGNDKYVSASYDLRMKYI